MNERRIRFLLNVFAVIFLVIAGLLYFYRSQTIETQRFLYENHFDSKDDLNRIGAGNITQSWISPKRSKDVVIELSNEQYHSPPYSCKCLLLNPSGGTEEEKVDGIYRRISARIQTNKWKEYYAYCWHYFKSPFANTRPTSIMGVKEWGLHEPERSWRLQMMGSLQGFHKIGVWKQVFNGYGKVPNYTDLGFALPLDTWFRTGVYVYKHKTDGIIRFYWNDKVVFEATGVETQYAEDSLQCVTVHFNYPGYQETTQFTNYFDDVIISDRFISIEEETKLFHHQSETPHLATTVLVILIIQNVSVRKNCMPLGEKGNCIWIKRKIKH